VDADEDAVGADASRAEEQQDAQAAVEGEDCEGDREGQARMVARERVVGAVVDEQQRLARVVDEGAVVEPEVWKMDQSKDSTYGHHFVTR
jgi:hypothetical protein